MLMAEMRLDSEASLWMPLAGCLALIGSSVACAVGTAYAPIIDEYKEASCVPVSVVRRVQPHTREWDSRLAFEGGQILVTGAQIPGGRIAVSGPASNHDIIAADPGDYIYPSDVRFNPQPGILYTKAHGFAGGLREQTWLFKYDLRRHEITERTQIRNGILPAECEAVAARVVP